jgi:hypothetical protein
LSQNRPEEINLPLKEKERVEASKLVPMKIESMEFEKIHPVVEKVDTQEEEKEEEAKNKMIQDADLIEDNHRLSTKFLSQTK